MVARKIFCTLLMVLGVALIVIGHHLSERPERSVLVLTLREFTFVGLWAMGIAVLVPAYIAGWFWDGIRGNKPIGLLKLYFFGLAGCLVIGGVPIVLAAAFHKGDHFVNQATSWILATVIGVNAITFMRKSKSEPHLHELP